ncbi:hypothetical protein Fmac_026375 [Flemingia macrophylla]|uniref:Uncharacterized protein n=1 Tax=Flemingia macrophylla TaxID=520843 RepID=A0ABD1LEV0_9FABA
MVGCGMVQEMARPNCTYGRAAVDQSQRAVPAHSTLSTAEGWSAHGSRGHQQVDEVDTEEETEAKETNIKVESFVDIDGDSWVGDEPLEEGMRDEGFRTLSYSTFVVVLLSCLLLLASMETFSLTAFFPHSSITLSLLKHAHFALCFLFIDCFVQLMRTQILPSREELEGLCFFYDPSHQDTMLSIHRAWEKSIRIGNKELRSLGSLLPMTTRNGRVRGGVWSIYPRHTHVNSEEHARIS